MWRISDIKCPENNYNPTQKEVESFVNVDLVKKIDDIQEFDESSIKKISYWDEANDSELARIFENADERDVLTVCYVAVRRFPLKYLTVLMDYLLEKEEN